MAAWMLSVSQRHIFKLQEIHFRLYWNILKPTFVKIYQETCDLNRLSKTCDPSHMKLFLSRPCWNLHLAPRPWKLRFVKIGNIHFLALVSHSTKKKSNLKFLLTCGPRLLQKWQYCVRFSHSTAWTRIRLICFFDCMFSPQSMVFRNGKK